MVYKQRLPFLQKRIRECSQNMSFVLEYHTYLDHIYYMKISLYHQVLAVLCLLDMGYKAVDQASQSRYQYHTVYNLQIRSRSCMFQAHNLRKQCCHLHLHIYHQDIENSRFDW